jgi:hypothetical protein
LCESPQEAWTFRGVPPHHIQAAVLMRARPGCATSEALHMLNASGCGFGPLARRQARAAARGIHPARAAARDGR